MSERFTIEKAVGKDIPDLIRLLGQINMIHHNGRPDLFRPHATKYTEDELAAILADEKTPVFVCRGDGGEVRGYSFCIVKEVTGSKLMTDFKTLYIDDLCVDESARGEGVGSKLYEYCADFARGIGCDSVTLNVWSFNSSAVRFYEKMGMTPQKVTMEMIIEGDGER